MGGEKVVTSHVVSGLEVSSLENDDFFVLPNVFSQVAIPASEENIPRQEDVNKWPHLSQVQLPSIRAGIDLLIGTNVPRALEPWQVVPSVDNGPYAVKTRLGWIINGPLRVEHGYNTTSRPVQVLSNRISVATLDELWSQQFKNDFPECQDDHLEMSRDEIQFMEIVSQSASLVKGHYCISLPLRNKDIKMPNNRRVAEQRALNIKRQFMKNAHFKTDYTAFLNDVIAKGYAVEIPSEELNRSDGKVWYLPHHGVYHPKKLKIRVVFDCGASYQGTSLNGQLLHGPDLTSTLLGVILRFRQEEVAVMADVEAMFHQVKVPDEDADLLRFLWWPSGDISQDLKEYRMAVHLFGATSSPSCANFALRRCAEDNRDRFGALGIDTVLHNCYVDDCLKSVSTEDEALQLYHDLKGILETGGFHLAKWVSNRRAVLSAIPAAEERATELKDLDLDLDALPAERALGVHWCIQSDTFKFKLCLKDKPPTRRNILSIVGSLYDPLGILAPVILPAKMILQELCRLKIGWDELIPEHVMRQWYNWMKDLHLLEDLEVARCFKPIGFGETTFSQLHHFADASETGYGTVSYLLQKNKDNRIHCTLVMAKARVAPLKPITVPRMELAAATMAAHMDKTLRSELQLQLKESVFWSDSTTVLKYIGNRTSRFRTFVANRVETILKLSEVRQWRYVSTSQNPADHVSRGLKVHAFIHNETWLQGPDFLTKNEDEWPQSPDHSETLTTEDPEIRDVVVSATAAEKQADTVQQFLEYYSSWFCLRKAVAWILKVRNILLQLSRKRKELKASIPQSEVSRTMQSLKSDFRGSTLTVEDLKLAELEIVRFSQQQKYSEEISALRKGERLKKSSKIYKLNPILEDGILRVGGRLHRSTMPEEVKHPAILHKNLHVTNLILKEIHQSLGHSGRNHMLSKLQLKFWIPGAKAAIRRVLSKCVTCRRVHGVTGQQQMADLPRDRITPCDPPFTNTGVDYFGPFEVRRGRSIVKSALRRFFARRGQVKILRSDNGTNFVGAERELRRAIEEWNISRIDNATRQRGIQWMFNPPTGSHHGGAWERLIRSVRKILNTTLKLQTLDEEGFHTVLCEAEAIINSRPITKASSDPNDLEALTPNHLLLLNGKPFLPPGLFVKEDLYARRRWKQVQYMVDIFWKRWTREYLPQLQERQKWTHKSRNFTVGDIVLIVDHTAPRNSWVTGKVVQAIPDKNRLVHQ
ncbi:hypothetical protein NFI96_029603, partial [Prochilodus magdalenae]